jgi:ribosomal protein S18 acetylase RimI-like enzyme
VRTFAGKGLILALDVDLIARMDVSLAAYWGGYGLAEGSHLEEFSGASFFYTPIPLSLFNTVILTGQDPASIDAAYDRAASCIAEQGRPVLWRLSPTAISDEVRDQLERHGLQPQGRAPAMLMDLSQLPPPPRIDGLKIETVEGRSGRYNWAWLTSDAFELGQEVRAAMSQCEAAIPESEFASQPRYTGFLDGKAVAVSSLVMAANLAGIYAVATLSEARNRGIGTAMTLHAMEEGQKSGAKSAVLQATDVGRPVYEKIGFSTAYEYEHYLQT